jgi:ABC-type glycerol-3-phosphate transport system permease component
MGTTYVETRRRQQLLGKQFWIQVLMLLALAIAVAPFIWALFTSLKTEDQIYRVPPQILPDPFSLSSYHRSIEHGLVRSLVNSGILSIGTVVLSVLIGGHAAYGLARFNFRGSTLILFFIIAPMMIPGLVGLVPQYIIWAQLSLLDSYLGLIIIYSVSSLPVTVWILRGFFQSIPRELEEAAAIDGCSRLQTLYRIIVPLSGPALGAVALLAFLHAWNEFIIASIMISSKSMRTAQLLLYLNIGDLAVNWAELMAAAMAVNVPVLLLFFLLQKFFVGGLAAGAIKG